MDQFKFDLGQPVHLVGTGETGHVIARTDHLEQPPLYCVRQVAGDGGLVLSWWSDAAIEAAPAASES